MAASSAIDDSAGPNGAPDPPLLIEVRDLSIHYGAVVAVSGVSFGVPEGGLHGLIGPNGAGKTSVLDALSGYADCTGDILFRGRPITSMKIHRRARLGIARTFQSLELFDDLTVEENVMVGCDQRSASVVLRGMIRGGKWSTNPRVAELLEKFDLATVSRRRVFELSHGRRKMVMLARALAGNPELLLLDEPAAGLDSRESAELGAKLTEINAGGLTILMVEHDMSLVMNLCRHITVLDFGKVIGSGDAMAVQGNPKVVEAYLGSPAVDDGAGR